MKCVVAGGNVKVLGKAVHSLSRIGDELYLEPLEDGLSLRTVNSSRSAYACFLFAPLFFQLYQVATPGQDTLRCKILMKSFLSVFRSLVMLEKTVEKCCISMNGRSSRLVVQLHCKYGVRKTHNLSFQDCESLQAVFDPASCPYVLRAPAKVLGEAVLPFPLALAEVTLGIGRGRRVILRSYQEEETDSTIKAMVTEMSIGEEDFQQLQAQEGVAITFCLKEFRGLLSFAESANLSLSIHFDAPGRPAIFAIKDSLLDGHFVLATLSEPSPNSQDLCSPELRQPAPQLQAHSPPATLRRKMKLNLSSVQCLGPRHPRSSAHCSLVPSWPLHTPPWAPALCWLKTVRVKAELRTSSVSRGPGLDEATAHFSVPARGGARFPLCWVVNVGWAGAELAGPAASPCSSWLLVTGLGSVMSPEFPNNHVCFQA
ncbi:cell cycle checkpoint control protein RAD9A isoform 1-T1 [Molossus nigricans]